jgi:hypothetical protein
MVLWNMRKFNFIYANKENYDIPCATSDKRTRAVRAETLHQISPKSGNKWKVGIKINLFS